MVMTCACFEEPAKGKNRSCPGGAAVFNAALGDLKQGYRCSEPISRRGESEHCP